MTYTIRQVAARMGITVSTLSYYDKEGLLSFVYKLGLALPIQIKMQNERKD